MLYSLEDVRGNIRNREGKRVFFLGKGDNLTSEARDYLLRERIPILPGESARRERWALAGGGWTEGKPEHFTHLNGDVLVPKNHRRIRFRGKLDTLEAELICCQLRCPEIAGEVGEILRYVRNLLRREVLGEPVPEEKLLGLTEEELRRRSHFPQEYYGQPHFMPEYADGEAVAALNRCRCAAREAELEAVEAFTDRDGQPVREDLLRGMNRLSSALYLLMIRQKAQARRDTREGRKE